MRRAPRGNEEPDAAERARVSRARSRVLAGLFAFSLAATALAVHGGVVAATRLPGGAASLAEPSAATAVLVAILWTATLSGAFSTWLDARAGGAVLARRLGAAQASDRSRHAGEARLLRLVAETSIAAGAARPNAFVLRDEPGIDAPTLGGDGTRRALIVTAGALEQLDDAGLRAVVDLGNDPRRAVIRAPSSRSPPR